ncbi:unnamed protein product [Cyprideis torosa]|uniref:Uncharacterized protein n=1 Tax=Cyprideis torosa TaxID=163714 RepID=A0A7R8WM94_9CRUS|nr:unnamed protein product [Cyprideis torosa]CAG0905044.1 unnamed protein product [Cyprideis torosa]
MDPMLMAVNRPYQKVRIGPPEPPGPDDRGVVNIIPNATRSPKPHPKEPFAHQNYPRKLPFIPRQEQSSTKLRDFHQKEIFQ